MPQAFNEAGQRNKEVYLFNSKTKQIRPRGWLLPAGPFGLAGEGGVDPTAISCLVMWRFKPSSMRVTFSVITLQKLRPLNSTSTFLHCSISSISHSLRLTSFTLSNVSITRTRAQRTPLISHRQVKHTTHHLVEHNAKPKFMRLSNPTQSLRQLASTRSILSYHLPLERDLNCLNP